MSIFSPRGLVIALADRRPLRANALGEGSDQLDEAPPRYRLRQTLVPGQQSGPEYFGEGNICSIVRREIRSERPDPRQESLVRMAGQRKARQLSNGDLTTKRRQLAARTVASQDLGNLDI